MSLSHSMSLCALTFICLIFTTVTVDAHNWLTSPARGNKGENYNGFTSPPCPQKGSRVHVQVGPGQRFPIEWASGHGYGSFTFLVVMSSLDESEMIRNTNEVLNDYLNLAPPAALQYMSDSKAVHVSHAGPANDASLNADITVAWARPASFRKFANARVYSKKATATANDKRAKYKSEKYPWLISVSKFALHEDKPEDMDSALVEIPSEYPSGQYVVQYSWSGYYDCTDVNLLTAPSTDLYGSAAPAADAGGFDRVHHCLYTPSLPNYRTYQDKCFEVKENESGDNGNCAAECQKNNECDSYIVSPAVLPASAKYRGTFTPSQNSHLPAVCDKLVAGFTTDKDKRMVCYPIRSGDRPVVGPPYKIVTDPEDPVFYSTCYQRKAAWTFKDTCVACNPPPATADFRFGDQCISCRDMNRNYLTSAGPFWKVADVCEDCDAARG